MCDGEMALVMLLIIVFLALGIGIGVSIESSDIHISQETADDICINLTGNESAVAYDGYNNPDFEAGKFGCELPSYDATQNIIIKTNNE